MKPIAEMSLETRSVCEALQAVKVGNVITYREISKACDRDVQSGARYILTNARRILKRDNSIVFGLVHNIGLKRLNDVGIVSEVATVPGKIARAAKRGRDTLSKVQNFDAMPPDAKVDHNRLGAQLGAIGIMSKRKAANKIEQAVRVAQSELPPGDALRLFAK